MENNVNGSPNHIYGIGIRTLKTSRINIANLIHKVGDQQVHRLVGELTKFKL